MTSRNFENFIPLYLHFLVGFGTEVIYGRLIILKINVDLGDNIDFNNTIDYIHNYVFTLE